MGALAAARLVAGFGTGSLRGAQLSWAAGVTATWAHTVVVATLAYAAAGTTAVGLVTAARCIPLLVAAPLLAAVVDRLGGHVAMRIGAGACAAGTLATAFVPGAVAGLLTVTAVVSVGSTLVRQAHSARLPGLAGSRLTSANAVATAMEGAGMFAGPALVAGPLAAGQPGTALVLATVVAAAGVPLAGRGPGRAHATRATVVLSRRDSAAVRGLLGLLLVQTAVAGALAVLLVACAARLLGLGASGAGLLTTAYGLGALAGGVEVVARASETHLWRWIRSGLLLWGLPLVAIAVAPVPAVAVALLALVGVGNARFDVALITLLQRAVPPPSLSRTLGRVELTVATGTVLGALTAPLLVAGLGPRAALALTGAVLPAVLLTSRRRIAQAGLPGVSDGAATPGRGYSAT